MAEGTRIASSLFGVCLGKETAHDLVQSREISRIAQATDLDQLNQVRQGNGIR